MGCEICKPADSEDRQVVSMVEVVDDREQAVLTFLSKMEWFEQMSVDQHAELLSACITQGHPANHVLMTQDDHGDAPCVIMSGQVVVKIDNEKIATMSTGDCLWDQALSGNAPHISAIIAATPISLLKIRCDKFYELGLIEKLHPTTFQAVGGHAECSKIAHLPHQKDTDERTMIVDGSKKTHNLQAVSNPADTKSMQAVSNPVDTEACPAGKQVAADGGWSHVGTDDASLNEEQAKVVQQTKSAKLLSRMMESLRRRWEASGEYWAVHTDARDSTSKHGVKKQYSYWNGFERL